MVTGHACYRSDFASTVIRRLVAMAGCTVVLTALICAVLVARGDTVAKALAATAPGHAVTLLEDVWTDSWGPMLNAYRYANEHPEKVLYGVFFEEHVKFQYPPSSLLLFDLIPERLLARVAPAGGSEYPHLTANDLPPGLLRLLTWISGIAVLVTVVASGWILKVGVARQQQSGSVSNGQVASLVALGLGFGLTFFPILTGHELGQIQTLLNAATAVAILFYLLDRRGLAGGLIGACCLIKPQFALVLLWGLWRRDWRFSIALAGVGLAGFVLALARFGIHAHFAYLDVLGGIARAGEAYWANQSLSGLLNRLLQNGSPTRFDVTGFAPHSRLVYVVTLMSSAALLVVAMWPSRTRESSPARHADFLLMLVVATIASPVAWNHHFGAFFPIFAAVVPWVLSFRPLGAASAIVLALSYASVANVILRPEWFFLSPVRGLMASHMFFGVLLLLLMLVRIRAMHVAAEGPPIRGATASHQEAAGVSRA